MNNIIKTTSLFSFLLMSIFSPLFAQTIDTDKDNEALKKNAEYNALVEEAENEDSFYIFNSTNLKVEFTVMGDESSTETLEPYKPQKENYEDINGKLFIFGLDDRKSYSPDYRPYYIEYKPTPESEPVIIEIEYYGSYTCYVFYLSEGKLKLGRHN